MDIVPIGTSHTRESVSTDGHNKVAEDRVPIATLLFFIATYIRLNLTGVFNRLDQHNSNQNVF